MAGRRSDPARLARTPDERRRDFKHDETLAQLQGEKDTRFKVNFQFGSATYLRSSLTAIDAGVLIPSQIDVDFSRDRNAPLRTMKIEVRQHIPVCTEIRLSARSDGRGLRPMDLQAIDLSNWIEDILSECTWEIAPDGIPIHQPGAKVGRAAVKHAQKAGRRKISTELLTRVAAVYRAHIDARPIEAIQAEFDLDSYRTAARYVQMCRSDEYQLLPKTQRGQRKA
jgi:hypothetical protein